MHACLNVDEIVWLIACELVASKAKASAVALACCHKAFEDPVLDALWEIQGGLLPLPKSLPGDVWNEGECTVSVSITHTFPSLNYLVRKVIQKASDDTGMDSLPEVRSKDAKAQTIWGSVPHVF